MKQLKAPTQLKVSTIFASLAVLSLLFSPAVRADGPLYKGDTAHPVSLLVQSSGGSPVNGDALTMHITSVTGGVTTTGTGTFSQPDTANQPGVYIYTLSASDAAAEVYGETLFQATDASGSNLINPERRTVVANNPFAAGVTVGGYAPGQDPYTLLMAGAFITIPGDHTTSGQPVTLTYKQMLAIPLAVPASDNASTAPIASGTATTSYYLAGLPAVAANLVYVGTVTYNAAGQQTGRTVKIAAPFPSL